MLTLTRWVLGLLFLSGLSFVHSAEMNPAPAQSPYTPLDSSQLEELLGSVALYPDDLLAIVLPASTFPLQIVQAARFRERTPDAKPDEKWDDSVVALLNYPEVLKKLNDDLDWTWRLGEAVINQQEDVLAAVSNFRERAKLAGNLKSDDKQVVEVREKIVYIRPVSERVIYVPYYDPWEVTTYRTRQVYHYYPDPYPVYYYPYDYGYRFPHNSFWGVSTWYNIGWSNHHLHSLHYSYRHHPYYGRQYHDYHGHHSWRHQRPPHYRNHEQPHIVNGEPVLPDDTTWYPREGHGARQFGNRREHNESPLGRPAPETGLRIPVGGGGTPPASMPENPIVNSGVPDEPVVYEGNVNGEHVRVIRRGTRFDTTGTDEARSSMSETSAPVVQGSTTYGGEQDPAIQAAVERARQQASEQVFSSQQSTGDSAPVWRSEQPAVHVSPEPQVIDNEAINRAVEEARRIGDTSAPYESRRRDRAERQSQVYSAPVQEDRHSRRQHERPQEQPRWEENPAVQEAISLGRELGGHGNEAPRHDSRGSRFDAPPRFEAPAREERSESPPEPVSEAPRQEERSESPVDIPAIPDIRY